MEEMEKMEKRKPFFFSTSSISFHGIPRFKKAGHRFTESWQRGNQRGYPLPFGASRRELQSGKP
jgi:hypothetical protein